MIGKEHRDHVSRGSVRTAGGQDLGPVHQVYADDATGALEWATVSTAAGERFVPLRDAKIAGGAVVVPYDAALVHDAPGIDGDQGHLSRVQEADLYAHYGLLDPASVIDPGLLVDSRRPLGGPLGGDATSPGLSGPADGAAPGEGELREDELAGDSGGSHASSAQADEAALGSNGRDGRGDGAVV